MKNCVANMCVCISHVTHPIIPCSFFVTQVQVIYISRGYVLDDSTQNNCKCICQCPANIQGINYCFIFHNLFIEGFQKAKTVGSMSCVYNDDGTDMFLRKPGLKSLQ